MSFRPLEGVRRRGEGVGVGKGRSPNSDLTEGLVWRDYVVGDGGTGRGRRWPDRTRDEEIPPKTLTVPTPGEVSSGRYNVDPKRRNVGLSRLSGGRLGETG